MDFLQVKKRKRKNTIEIYPEFIIPEKKSTDLMIRGSDFYAFWNEETKMWSTDENECIKAIDQEIQKYYNEIKGTNKLDDDSNERITPLYLKYTSSGMIDIWHKYVKKQLRDNFHQLDAKVIFSNQECTKKDYATKTLPYPIQEGSTEAFDRLASVLYSPEELQKIIWCIGAIITGDSQKIQKFLVLYGAPKTGKSTILNIIADMFDGYYSVFDARTLGSSNNGFALEAFKENPLLAIQHDGDLSRIEDNTRLNSLVSHETMMVNEKFKTAYQMKFRTFLFMGTNKPVKITDAKSGLIRRLIDVAPTGEKVSKKEYDILMSQIKFEYGAIAYKCKIFYEENKGLFDDYVPLAMMGASNDFYNFIEEYYAIFEHEDNTTLTKAYELYDKYCQDAKVAFPLARRPFGEELKEYFKNYEDRHYDAKDGVRIRSYYSGFKGDKFRTNKTVINSAPNWLDLKEQSSLFDDIFKDCKAQYATTGERQIPTTSWAKCTTVLKDIRTKETHYVKLPEEIVTVDFDFKDEQGNKSLEKNIEQALLWPKTYAEVSKSGGGLHLTYIYDGDISTLKKDISPGIEVKVNTGNASLRRRLSLCNNIPIAHISNLPQKEARKKDMDARIISEKELRRRIENVLAKKYDALQHTTPCINFIAKLLDDAYNSEMMYDVRDMYGIIFNFAANSTNQKKACIEQVAKMKFISKDFENKIIDIKINKGAPRVFFDIEIFPNLLIICWKFEGKEHKPVIMINPEPKEVEKLLEYRLVGFNNRRYDNHIIYARIMGYTIPMVYDLSQRIIVSKESGAMFGKAYGISEADVFDFSSAGNKQSLKKWEIELGLPHKECQYKWDQPVPEEHWQEVAEYCCNDVIATEAVFNHLQPDFIAREILADLSGLTINDTTNQHTTKIIFGDDKNPALEYRFLGDESVETSTAAFVGTTVFDNLGDPEYTRFDVKSRPIFPGYKFDISKRLSTYRGEEVGEGGYVYAEPNVYTNVALLDVASMHPSSVIAENLFGDKYTKQFKNLMQVRIYIKHKEFDKAKELLGEKFEEYLNDPKKAKALSNALKTAINSVYGLTSASFKNPFKDVRNVDNIVAKRGALFMINLKHEVQRRGFIVAHIKTDSIKIPDATPEIIDFVMNYGKMYGYTFEHEATYSRMCLVNDAVYIARYATKEFCEGQYGYIPEKNQDSPGEWTATGTQFQVPTVFKELFSHEEIDFKDYCVTNSVKTAIYLDYNEELPEDEHCYSFVGRVGSFVPVKDGYGGGILLSEREKKDGTIGYNAVTGSKGYRWFEASDIKDSPKKFEMVDNRYFDTLITDAKDAITKYCDFNWFVSDCVGKPVPPWCTPCGNGAIKSCFDCPNYIEDPFHLECKLGYDITENDLQKERKLA